MKQLSIIYLKKSLIVQHYRGMNNETWTAFCKTLGRCRSLIGNTNAAAPDLTALIQRLVTSREGPAYTVETPVVYNLALDDFTPESEIKMILVGDNPGRREQENGRYLVGPSGKIAEKFFKDHPELGIDFRKNVIILNKTPIHTPRTIELKELCKLGGKQAENAVLSSQRTMAELLAEFWQIFSGDKPHSASGSGETLIWIIGYSEMKKGGVFEVYTETLKTLCAANPALKESIFFFRHFSMNQFAIDLKQQTRPGENLTESLRRIGAAYRKRVLG